MMHLVQQIWEKELEPRLPETLVATAKLKGFGLFKVPMIFWVKPSVVALNENKIVVKIPLCRRTKNHLNSMYFGALAVGADAAIGLLAMNVLKQKKARGVQLVFKDFKANFLKRPTGDVHFICEEGEKIQAQVEKTMASGERVTEEIKGYAIVPSISTTEPVCEFSLGLSLKKK